MKRIFGYTRPSAAMALLAVLSLVLAGSIGWAATPDADGVLHGCAKSGSGALRLIDSGTGETCGQNELPVSWNQTGPPGPQGPGKKTIAGLVNLDGTTAVGSGFTSVRIGPGEYEIRFPGGTWSTFPVLVVTPFGLPGGFPVAEVGSIGGSGGAATARILVSSTAGPWTPLDAAFWFIAVES
jgi:hypothetical protein